MEKKQVIFDYIEGTFPHHQYSLTIEMEFPEFEGSPRERKLQQLWYLDEMDKRPFMDEHDMQIILDYRIVEGSEKSNEYLDFLNFLKVSQVVLGLDGKMLHHVLEYAAHSTTIFGKGKSNGDKLMEILDGVRLSLMAQSTVWDKVLGEVQDVETTTEKILPDFDYYNKKLTE